MTSTEIVIRIKKARKKWKLVIPKKRVAAYRTNRWFAKPRWVEIELTYAQALKHGLVEPRTPSTEVTGAIPAEQQAAGLSVVDSDHTLPAGSASEHAPDRTSTWQRHRELEPNIEQSGQNLNADDVDFVSDNDHLEDDAVLPRTLPPRTDRAAPRAGALLLIAASALLLLSVPAAWITLGGIATTPMTADLACTPSEQSPSCTQTIVTGAIDKMDQPQSPESRSSALASSEPISAIEQLQLSAPATTPTEREDASGKVGNAVDNGNERTATANAAAENDPLPAETTPKASLLVPQNMPADRRDCRELRAARHSINIPFDYGSSSLNQAVLPALESFAERLRSCPSTKVIVEGHTDSDGSAAWNQALSVHRAKAVARHLVHAGVQPSQLSAIGFGQSRPYAPNVSTRNKRSNRRVALVVDVRR